jgi:long-chain acyl-CoA synthetase
MIDYMVDDRLFTIRNKIAHLTNDEKKLRDVYLRKLAIGELQGPPTGYGSIDKIWLKYYDEYAIKKDFAPMSAYQLMKKCNEGHETDIALNYFGKKISYGEMLENIDTTACALVELGVQKGDVVLMSMPNTPEAEYLFYAVNKIGGILNSIDPRSSKESLQKDILQANVQFIFVLEDIYNKISSRMDIDTIKKIVTISPLESAPVIVKCMGKMRNVHRQKNEKLLDWGKFIILAKHREMIDEIYEPNSTAVIVHTGGSTGIPKGVELSNEAFNSLIYQFMYSNMGLKRRKKYLNILPPFIALGLDNSMHLAACMGLEAILIPSFEPKDFPKLVLKYKPNMIMGGPIHYKMMTTDEKMKKANLAYLEICVSGGDKMQKEMQEQIQGFLKEHGAPANLWIGYGATEVSSGISCVKDDCFRFESVGAPYLKNIVKICNTETGSEVYGYGKVGELKINAPTLMIGYFGDMQKETEKVMSVEDNLRWYHTGDLAHLDRDGMLYIDGRIKRIITRRGFKIYPAYVEELILRHYAVKECAVVGVEDAVEISVPVANIVIKEEYNDREHEEEIIRFVDKLIREELPEYSAMAGYNFLENLPVTPMGKLDFSKLEKMGIIGA